MNKVKVESKQLAIFSYSFPHRKTTDFLHILYSNGFRNISVVAAPKVFVNNGECNYEGECTQELCEYYGYRFIETAHSNVEVIRSFLSEVNATETAIISGARILKAEIIDIFRDGIINFHPGEIPATSGLDSFYWMIKNYSKPGTTAHYIDHRVDAGNLIEFTPADIDADDDYVTLRNKIYASQILSLKNILFKLKSGNTIERTLIFRPFKNNIMSDNEKEVVMQGFDLWKKHIIQNSVS